MPHCRPGEGLVPLWQCGSYRCLLGLLMAAACLLRLLRAHAFVCRPHTCAAADRHLQGQPQHFTTPRRPPQMSGRVVWTGSSSLDIRMELEQAGQLQLSALFTFVARDALSGKPVRINSLQPQEQQVEPVWGEGRGMC